MSKQSIAKEAQGYTPKAEPKTCATCAHFRSDIEELPPGWDLVIYTKERNLRCGIGGFAVKKLGACKLWEKRP